jgi:enamine deaminase RidA (YjgF/YER057c/UK114 family)
VTRRVPSPSRYADPIGFSAAVRAGDWVMVAGTTALAPDGTVVGGDSARAQTLEALRKVGLALDQAGASLADVVRTRMYLVDTRLWEEVGRAHGEVFGAARPAATMVGVAALLDPRMLVEVEAVAWVGSGPADQA